MPVKGATVGWKTFRIKLRIKQRLVGNLPPDEKLIGYAAKASAKELGAEEEAVKEEMLEDTALAREEAEEEERPPTAGLLVLPRDEYGIYVRGNRHVKGLLKEAIRMLGIRGATEVIRHAVDVIGDIEDRIYLRRGGRVIKEPDGLLRRGIKAMTMRGPRASIKLEEFVESKPGQPIELEFCVRILGTQWGRRGRRKAPLDEETWNNIWEVAQVIGLLGERSLGEGQFMVVEIKEITEEELRKWREERAKELKESTTED